MGRYNYNAKAEADGLLKVSTSELNKWGYFDYSFRTGNMTWTNNYSGNKNSISLKCTINKNDKHLRFIYTQTDYDTEKKTDFDYKIPLTTTPCYFGGKRYWFICPWYKNSIYCGKRVGVLYKYQDYFACRHCYELSYASKNENRKNKLFTMFEVMRISKQIEELEQQITTPYYNGKPTKKYKKLMKLRDLMYRYHDFNITRDFY